MDAKIEPHRARSVTFNAICRNYKKIIAESKKKKKIGNKR